MTLFKKVVSSLLLLLMIFCLVLPATAEEEPARHISYQQTIFNESQGLLTGESNAVAQGKDGYLWIGAYSGLVRYDGSQMVDFSSQLESSAVRALHAAKDGALYVGTNAASVYRMEKDTFTRLSAEDPHSFLSIRDFEEGPDGTIYLASPSGVAKIQGDLLIPYAWEELAGKPKHWVRYSVSDSRNSFSVIWRTVLVE